MFDDGAAGLPVNKPEALRLLELSAVQGFVIAQYNCGRMYYLGEGAAKNGDKSFHCFSLAAAQGYPDAVNGLGNCYSQGFGVTKDDVKAFTHYLHAAELGNMLAIFNVGACFEKGKGTTADLSAALKWYGEAAAAGIEAGKVAVGMIAAVSLFPPFPLMGVFRFHLSETERLKNMKPLPPVNAAANESALIREATEFQFGLNGVNKDLKKRDELYRKAADLGDIDGLVACSYYGIGCPENDEKALEYARIGVSQNRWYSQCVLGTPQHPVGPLLHPLEADPNFGLSVCLVAWIHDSGMAGLPVNKPEALRLYEMSAAQRYAIAQSDYGSMFYSGHGTAKNGEKAFHYYSLAAAQGYAKAINGLGSCYYHGVGVAKDYAKAYAHCLRAAELGNATNSMSATVSRKVWV